MKKKTYWVHSNQSRNMIKYLAWGNLSKIEWSYAKQRFLHKLNLYNMLG